MSGSAIRDGLKATLTSASMFSAQEVSVNDYGILGRVAGCAVVILPGDADIDPHTFQRSEDRDWSVAWTFPLACYIRDRGDSAAVLDGVIDITDSVVDAIHEDQTLNSTACAAHVTQARVLRSSDGGLLAVDAGGHTWLYVLMMTEALEVKGQ